MQGQRYVPHLPAAGGVEEHTRRLEAHVRYVNRVALPPRGVRPLDGLSIEDDRTLIATAAAAHYRHWSAKIPRFRLSFRPIGWFAFKLSPAAWGAHAQARSRSARPVRTEFGYAMFFMNENRSRR